MKTTNCVFRIAVCMAILFTLFFNPSPAKACSCLDGVTFPDSFAAYDAVFTGKVVRIADNYAPIFSTADYILHKLGYPLYFFYHFVHNNQKRLGFSVFFKVTNSWKGIESTTVKINTGRGDGDCGYSFTPNQEYLVYASHAYGIPDNYLVTSVCSRTAELATAAKDLNYLTSKSSIALQYSLPIFWTEQDSIILGLISLPAISIIILIRKFRRKK